ncbi:hypothetical protein M1293_00300 [Candidatus Parvarchaeota archaeon]|nr:hypothetical protein [Candidatus Parvarchaeota archaeon]
MEKNIIIGIGAVLVVTAILFLIGGFNKSTGPAVSLQSSSDITQLASASQSLYASSPPFNFSFVFSFYNQGQSDLSYPGTFWIEKYGQEFRANVIARYLVPNTSASLNTKAITFFDGKDLSVCRQEFYTNSTPVNSTIESTISAINSRSFLSCSKFPVPSNITSFDMAYIFNTIPLIITSVSNTSVGSISPLSVFKGASIQFLGSKSMLGYSCYIEKVTSPPNISGGPVSFTYCISAETGLPLSLSVVQNSSVMLGVNLSSIGTAPSSSSQITSAPVNKSYS